MKKRLLASLVIAVGVFLSLALAAFASVDDAEFYDVPAGAWYADAVQFVSDKGLMSGKGEHRFDPAGLVTRAEVAAILYRCLGTGKPAEPLPPAVRQEDAQLPALRIIIGEQSYTATLEDNETTRALLKQLPLTISMGELNGNEKFYFMSENLPVKPQSPGHIETGDFMLYGSNCLVLFYEDFSSLYSYTRLGRLNDPVGFAAAVGSGSVTVTLRVD